MVFRFEEYSEANSVWNQGEFYEDFGTDQLNDNQELFTINQKIDINSTDTTFYNYLSQSVDFYPEFINQESDSVVLDFINFSK